MMGRFQCASCGRAYFERRFLWEQELQGDICKEFIADESVSRLGFSVLFSDGPQTMEVTHVERDSWADSMGIEVGDILFTINERCASSFEESDLVAEMQLRPLYLGVSATVRLDRSGHESVGSSCSSRMALPANKDGCQSNEQEEPNECNEDIHECKNEFQFGSGATFKKNAPSMGSYADAARAVGATANFTGTVAPALAHAVAPFSAVGGVCGTVGGVCQLVEGVSTPSGLVDPHLVAKGSVTASVGTICTSLGLFAAAVPFAAGPLILSALGLGVAGFSTATYLDANMSGLCQECRDGCCACENEVARDTLSPDVLDNRTVMDCQWNQSNHA